MGDTACSFAPPMPSTYILCLVLTFCVTAPPAGPGTPARHKAGHRAGPPHTPATSKGPAHHGDIPG